MGRDTILVAANDNLPMEEWRPVPSMPGIEASSHGRVRRLPHVGTMPYGGQRVYEPKPTFGTIRSASKDARHLFFGYSYRGFGNIKVHFAVCEAFHGQSPEGKKRVRHLNENGLDNRPSNLVWARQKTNMNDPVLKNYQHRRVSPKSNTDMSSIEKRAGVYDSIKDFAERHIRRLRAIAANDNEALDEIDKFVRMNELRLSAERPASPKARRMRARSPSKGRSAPSIQFADRDAEILRRHEAGDRHPAIAKHYGISRERVRKIVLLMGGAPRRARTSP